MKSVFNFFLPANLAFIFLLVYCNATAQTYFAGTGAGTGNSGGVVTGVGVNALSSGNSGNYNAAFGGSSLKVNTTGSNNAAFGANSMSGTTTGGYNSGFGSYVLFYNTTGTYNTALGYRSMFNNITGTENIAIGAQALYTNTYGRCNTAIGRYSMYSSPDADSNTAVGFYSMYKNTVGVNNTALGLFSLRENTQGTANTAVGAHTLTANTTGIYNTAIGNNSLFYNTTASANTSVGANSLNLNTTGVNNTSVGVSSLLNSNGSNNTSMGSHSLVNLVSGDNNSSLGFETLHDLDTGSNNTCIGKGALSTISSGSYNTAVGGNSGVGIAWDAVANNSTFLGYRAITFTSGLTNAMALGYSAIVDASNKVVIGNYLVTSIGGQVGWTTISDRRLKTNINKSKLGLSFIRLLNPVNYNYTAEGQKDILYTGLIAQEVDEAATKSGAVFSGVDKSGQFWGIRYAELTVPIIKAVQEMADENQQLKDRIASLETEVQKIRQTGRSNFADIRLSSSKLFQNQPNPFTNSTTIPYDLQETDRNAMIIIRDLTGKLLRREKLSTTGKAQIDIKPGEMAAGTYTYSLIVNGATLDTKLMVLGK